MRSDRQYRIGEEKKSDGTSTFFVEYRSRDPKSESSPDLFDKLNSEWTEMLTRPLISKEEALEVINADKHRVITVETIYHEVE